MCLVLVCVCLCVSLCVCVLCEPVWRLRVHRLFVFLTPAANATKHAPLFMRLCVVQSNATAHALVSMRSLSRACLCVCAHCSATLPRMPLCPCALCHALVWCVSVCLLQPRVLLLRPHGCRRCWSGSHQGRVRYLMVPSTHVVDMHGDSAVFTMCTFLSHFLSGMNILPFMERRGGGGGGGPGRKGSSALTPGGAAQLLACCLYFQFF